MSWRLLPSRKLLASGLYESPRKYESLRRVNSQNAPMKRTRSIRQSSRGLTPNPGGRADANRKQRGFRALIARPLSGSLAESGEDKVYVDSGASKHVYQGINAKEIDPPANDVADPWLRDTK